MDGITLSVIRCELVGYLPLKVQKVQQPKKKELVLTVWSPSVRERLVLSLEGQEPFFGFSDEKKENPAVPPGFCLGLRKRLEGGTLASVRQVGLDRVICLDFDGHDDFGNAKRYVLVFDMAGREQNIGLYEDDLLVASMIPSDEGRFEHRSPYKPPASERLDIRGFAEPDGEKRLSALLAQREGTASRVLSDLVEGAGKDFVKGILAAASVGEADSISPVSAERLATVLAGIGRALAGAGEHSDHDAYAGEHSGVNACSAGHSGQDTSSGEPGCTCSAACFPICPTIYTSAKGLVLHAFPLPHLEVDSRYDSILEAARAYRERVIEAGEFRSLLAQADALHRKLLRKVQSRYEAQTGDLSRSQDYEKYRIWARLIDESGKRNPPGATEMVVVDYYADPPAEVTVPLDPKRSSNDNARAYYRTYAKLARAEKALQESLAALARDQKALAELRDALDRCVDAQSVAVVLQRLEALARREGIAVKAGKRSPKGSHATSRTGAGGSSGGSADGGSEGVRVRVVEGPDGAIFLVGGSAKQNDELVTRLRMPGDTWLHAKGVKGAHVLARPAPGQALSDEALLAAARLAAQKSEAKDSLKAEVDYVDAMKVRKPRGSAPGFVTYTGQKSLMVELADHRPH
ncbi:MAG: NFACT family protein [Bacillota bacterium]